MPVEPRRLAEDLTLVGLAVDAVLSDGKDTVLDLDITTNRVDCMNVYGVAREVSVLYDKRLRPLEVAAGQAGEPAAKALRVEVEAPDLCPRFCARVLDVRIGPSPQWLRDRLDRTPDFSPVIALTGVTADEDTRRIESAGVRKVLTKPVNVVLLLSSLRELLSGN